LTITVPTAEDGIRYHDALIGRLGCPPGQHFNNAHQVVDEVWHLYGLRVYHQGKSQAVNIRIAR